MTSADFELIGLILAATSIISAGAVLFLWRANVKRLLASKILTPAAWATFGTVLIYFGFVLDNTYWLTAWGGKFTMTYWFPALMEWGFLPNIPFRSVPAIAGAYCHLRAYFDYIGTERDRALDIIGLGAAMSLISGGVLAMLR